MEYINYYLIYIYILCINLSSVLPGVVNGLSICVCEKERSLEGKGKQQRYAVNFMFITTFTSLARTTILNSLLFKMHVPDTFSVKQSVGG